MSRGNKILKLRVRPELLAEIESVISARNERSSGEAWDMSGFLRAAIREKLDKMARSRDGAARRKNKGKGG